MATERAADRRRVSLATDSLTPLHWVGVALAAVTGVLHLALGASFGLSGLGVAFLVAGVGYLGGIAAVLVDVRRRVAYALGVPFTLGQIVAWYVVNAPDFSVLGLLDKVVQVALIAVLVVLYRRG
jgi:hypothetical protein